MAMLQSNFIDKAGAGWASGPQQETPALDPRQAPVGLLSPRGGQWERGKSAHWSWLAADWKSLAMPRTGPPREFLKHLPHL